MAIIHAITMLPATPPRSAEARRAAPMPAMVYVVEPGTPNPVARNGVIAPPVSAQNPALASGG